MSLFQTTKPRGFQHHYMYVDERRERLKNMEKRVMAQQQDKKPTRNDVSHLQGLFQKQVKKHRHTSLVSLIVVLFCTFILIVVLYILVFGVSFVSK